MKINRFLPFFIICTIIAGVFFPVTVKADDSDLGLPEFPEIESQYVVRMDADTKEVLFSRNHDVRCYPASTTKLLTGLLAIENCKMDDIITFSANAVNSIEYGDAHASIVEGEQLTIEQALYCLLLRSANEVAFGIAEHVSGNMSSFAALMNAKAQSVGAVNTNFSNASGLTDIFHYTTPYDMALIARECFNSKELVKISGHSGIYTIGPTNKNNFTRYYKARYDMLKGGEFEYEYCKAGKTGYTDAAGNCLVSYAEKDDLRLVCVIFNSGAATRYHDTEALFDFYLNNYKKVSIDKYREALSNNSIELLELTSKFTNNGSSLKFKDEAYLLVPNSVNADELTTIVTYADSPAYSGEEGGFACLSFFYGDNNVGTLTVFASDSQTKPSKVPTPFDNASLVGNDYFYLDIRIIAGGVLLIGAIVTIFIIFIKKKRHYSNRASKNLYF